MGQTIDDEVESPSGPGSQSAVSVALNLFRPLPLGEFEFTKRSGFGWSKKSKILIPYFWRYEKKFCSTRMLEFLCKKQVGTKPTSQTQGLVYDKSFEMNITEPEGRLLNHINYQHCEKEFGGKIFSCWDKAVPLTEAKNIITSWRNSMGILKHIVLMRVMFLMIPFEITIF